MSTSVDSLIRTIKQILSSNIVRDFSHIETIPPAYVKAYEKVLTFCGEVEQSNFSEARITSEHEGRIGEFVREDFQTELGLYDSTLQRQEPKLFALLAIAIGILGITGRTLARFRDTYVWDFLKETAPPSR